MAALDAILNDIDMDLENALERLFAFLRIPSISTDPGLCRPLPRGRRLARPGPDRAGLRDLRRGDLAASGRAGRTSRSPGAPHVLFYGHYDVQPVDPLDLWTTPPFEPHIADDGQGGKRIVGRGASDDKGQVMTFVEACRAHHRHERRVALRRHDPDRGRRGERLAGPARMGRGEPRAARLRRGAGLRHRHVGPEDPGHHLVPARARVFRGEGHLRRPRPAFGLLRRRGAQPDPRAGQDHRRPARCRRAGDDPGLLRRRARAPAGGAGAVARPRPDAGDAARADRPEGARRRARPDADRAGAVAPLLRRQRHHRRLYRRGHQDGDRLHGLGQGLVPPRGRPGPEAAGRSVRGLRARAGSGGLHGRGHHLQGLAGDQPALRHAAARRRQGGAAGRVGRAGA